MANKFVDTGLASGSNDGSDMDNAWQSIETALEYNAHAAGTDIWIRRRSSFASATSDIVINSASDGTATSPIRVIGWPRNSKAVTSSDWTNGSTAVVIDDNDMDREKHQGRFITAPDGKNYLITRVVDSNDIVIDREYVGATVTDQAATIIADENYATAQAIDDSAWTIKKSDWNGDADDLPKIDFEANAYQLMNNGARYWRLEGIEFIGGTDTNGTVYGTGVFGLIVRGCLFKQTQNAYCLQPGAPGWIDRCIFEGTGSGSGQYGLYAQTAHLTNCAIYNFGDWGVRFAVGMFKLENVNIGVEVANGDLDIYSSIDPGSVYVGIIGYDVRLGGTNGAISTAGTSSIIGSQFTFENFGKVLGAHRAYGYYIDRLAVVAGSGDPEKRTGGADEVIDWRNQISVTGAGDLLWRRQVFEHRIWADTTSKSYRYYCQQKLFPTLANTEIFLTADYVDSYDDASEYTMATVRSDETIAVRANAADWSQYVEVTGIQPAVAGWVILRLHVQVYDSDGVLYIDPQVVIS